MSELELESALEEGLEEFKKRWDTFYFFLLSKEMAKEAKRLGLAFGDLVNKVLLGELALEVFFLSPSKGRLCCVVKCAECSPQVLELNETMLMLGRARSGCLSEEIYRKSVLMKKVFRGLADLYPEGGTVTIQDGLVLSKRWRPPPPESPAF